MLTKHTDTQISDFIQKKAREGLFLTSVHGNRFSFRKKEYDGRRLCALTLYPAGHSVSTELQIREQLTEIRKRGWDCICVGRPETLKDSRRHVFLVEEVAGSEFPKAEPRSEVKAGLRGKFKAFSNALICVLYVAALLFLLRSDLMNIVTKNGYLLFATGFSLLLLLCAVMCLLSLTEVFGNYRGKRYLDFSTLFITVTLFFLALFLFADDFAQDRGNFEKVKIGTSSFRIYSDPVPVTLEDLGADTDGRPYRTSRCTESASFIASRLSFFDESFGVIPGATVYENSERSDVSFVSCSVFSSHYRWLLNAVISQQVPKFSVRDDGLSELLAVDDVFISADGTFVLCKDNRVITVKSGFELSTDALGKLAALM